MRCLLEEDLAGLLNITFPSSPDVGMIACGPNAPDPSEVKLWIQTDGTGVPLSINFWLDGAWNPILDLNRTPQYVKGDWLAERDSWAARGFVLSDGSNGTTDLRELFDQSASNPVNYSCFAVVFKGRQIIS